MTNLEGYSPPPPDDAGPSPSKTTGSSRVWTACIRRVRSGGWRTTRSARWPNHALLVLLERLPATGTSELVKPRLFGRNDAGEMVRHKRRFGPAWAQQVLAWVLDQTLRLLHPITPFVTEALWKELNATASAPGRDAADRRRAGPDPGGVARPRGAWPRGDRRRGRALRRCKTSSAGCATRWPGSTRRVRASKTPAIGKLPHAVNPRRGASVGGLAEADRGWICRLGPLRRPRDRSGRREAGRGRRRRSSPASRSSCRSRGWPTWASSVNGWASNGTKSPGISSGSSRSCQTRASCRRPRRRWSSRSGLRLAELQGQAGGDRAESGGDWRIVRSRFLFGCHGWLVRPCFEQHRQRSASSTRRSNGQRRLWWRPPWSHRTQPRCAVANCRRRRGLRSAARTACLGVKTC